MTLTGSNTRSQVEQLLEKALIIIELTNGLKEKAHIGERYACDLKSLSWKANQINSAIQQSIRDFLQSAEQIVRSALDIISVDAIGEDVAGKDARERNDSADGKMEENGKTSPNKDESLQGKDVNADLHRELLNLHQILEKDIRLCEKSSEIRLYKTKSSASIGDMIKTLQCQQLKRREALTPRICMDERYPEKTSKESLLDLAHPSLQTVFEDGFTDFKRSSPSPQRNYNGRSLRSIRRIKRILNDGGADTDSNDEDLAHSSVELVRSYSVHSVEPRDVDTDAFRSTNVMTTGRPVSGSDAVQSDGVKAHASGVNILLQNISEED